MIKKIKAPAGLPWIEYAFSDDGLAELESEYDLRRRPRDIFTGDPIINATIDALIDASHVCGRIIGLDLSMLRKFASIYQVEDALFVSLVGLHLGVNYGSLTESTIDGHNDYIYFPSKGAIQFAFPRINSPLSHLV